MIYAVDVGSIEQNNFGWAKYDLISNSLTSSSDINELVNDIAIELNNLERVYLGFECPLFVNISSEPSNLLKARNGEGNRPWSAGAGATSLTAGLTEVVWILNELKKKCTNINPTFEYNSEGNLFIWEAFVSSHSKGVSHENDAEIAVKVFEQRMQTSNLLSDVTVSNPYSLVGTALLRTGLSKDLSMLNQSCIVVKV